MAFTLAEVKGGSEVECQVADLMPTPKTFNLVDFRTLWYWLEDKAKMRRYQRFDARGSTLDFTSAWR
jgi:hypothetical protein